MINRFRSTPLYSIVLATLLTCAASAQVTMKVSGDGGGGIYPPGWKGRLSCTPNRTDGTPGPIARAAWKVVSPGFVNFCVRAGMQRNYAPMRPSGVINSNPADRLGASPQVNSNAASVALPMTLSLRDTRSASSLESDWIEGKESSDKVRAHVPTSYPSGTLTEPGSALIAVLPNAWCVNNLNWGSRPYLIVEASGPGARGHTAEHEISCSVEFGDAEPANANLLLKVSPPAWTSPSPSSQLQVAREPKK